MMNLDHWIIFLDIAYCNETFAGHNSTDIADDEISDPDFNFLDDLDYEEDDEEEIRNDKAVRIPSKYLYS